MPFIIGDFDFGFGHHLDGEHVGTIGFELFALDFGDPENGERLFGAGLGIGGAGEAVFQLILRSDRHSASR
jgi:hypothetical protein